MKNAFILAAPSSASGKTTVARGLMALFTQQGLRVQPFKCGPDYIDTKFHEAVCRRPSINLDTFMASPEHVRDLFGRYTQGGDDAPEWACEPIDIAIAEGMMGLFDGYDRDRGSTAEIARTLGLPVVLIVDARSAAYSVAALLQGFIRFRSDVHFAGVIFNKVGSPRHEAMLREVADEVGIACLGCISKQTALEQGSRYLGLDFSTSTDGSSLPSLLAQQLDIDALLRLTRTDVGLKTTTKKEAQQAMPYQRIFVACNTESFSFIYQETLDLLSTLAPITFFDPENGHPPFSTDDAPHALLYLPGGYPEKHLLELVDAEHTRRTIRTFADAGGRIIAECGGMMYLCKQIITDVGAFPACGILPYSITARQADRRLALGYRQFTLYGQEFRGHEFHYTRFADPLPASVVQVFDAKRRPVSTPILRYNNVIASYTHLAPTSLMNLVLTLGTD